jgi:hypothetical protein
VRPRGGVAGHTDESDMLGGGLILDRWPKLPAADRGILLLVLSP